MPPPTDNDSYVRCRVDKLLSSSSSDDAQSASDELFQYLSEHPRPAPPTSAKAQCAVAIDTGNECVADILSSFIPAQWQEHITVATYGRFTDVIRMVRATLPALLAIHSNFIVPRAGGATIPACVAVSPSTRYLLMTAWNEETIESLRKAYAPLQISMSTLTMPFSREQVIAALGYAAGDALPKMEDSH